MLINNSVYQQLVLLVFLIGWGVVGSAAAVENSMQANTLWRSLSDIEHTAGELRSIERFRSGPCAEMPTECQFDTHSVYYDTAGREIEVITANGKYWRFVDGQRSDQHGVWLSDIPRFARGPCAERVRQHCRFDTYAIHFVGDRYLESITVGNHIWDYTDGRLWDNRPLALTDIQRFRVAQCAHYQRTGECAFENRVVLGKGNAFEEVVVIGRQFWRFPYAGLPQRRGQSVARLPGVLQTVCEPADNPSCQIDTLTVFYAENYCTLEVMTSQGKYWVFKRQGLFSQNPCPPLPPAVGADTPSF